MSEGSDPQGLCVFNLLPWFNSSTCSQNTLTFPSCAQILVACDDSSVEVVLLPVLGGVPLFCHKRAAYTGPALPHLQVSRGHVQVSRPEQNAPVSLRDIAELQSVSEHFDVALKMLFLSVCPALFLSVPMLTPPLRSDPTVTKITRPPARGCSKVENLPQQNPSQSPTTFISIYLHRTENLRLLIYILFVLRDDSC